MPGPGGAVELNLAGNVDRDAASIPGENPPKKVARGAVASASG